MRIVFLNPVGNIGGAERSLLDLLASLREFQPAWSFTLIAGAFGPLADAARSLGVSVHVLPLSQSVASLGDAATGTLVRQRHSRARVVIKMALAAGKVVGYVRSLRAVLLALSPTLLHSNGFKMHILASWAKPAHVPLVWHVHDYISARPLMRNLTRFHASACSAVIANSASVAEDVRRVLGPKLKIYKLWNSVDLSEFTLKGPQLDLDVISGLTVPAGPVVRVGLIGTFARWKGHQVFLRAFAKLRGTPEIRGYIIGAPIYQTDASQWRLQDLKQIVDDLGLSGKVGFTGFVPRPAEAIRALDFVVHASTEPEPFGLVIIEAMACGRPVIVSRQGGAAEITDGDTGALGHATGDPVSLASRIEQLANDRDLCQRLSLAGRRNAERNFDRAGMGPACARIYESLNGGSGLFRRPPLVAGPGDTKQVPL